MRAAWPLAPEVVVLIGKTFWVFLDLTNRAPGGHGVQNLLRCRTNAEPTAAFGPWIVLLLRVAVCDAPLSGSFTAGGLRWQNEAIKHESQATL